MQRWQWAGVVAVLVVALGAGAWFGGRPPQPPPVEVAAAAGARGAAAPDREITVHVAGAVARPGLVHVRSGARVADALAAAGGALATAELSALNLAAPVVDGEQISVPVAGAPAPPPGVDGEGRVRINTAPADEIERLPGIGEVTAARIVAHREEHGPFATVEDLLDVPGIGEGRLAALRDLVIVP